MWSGGKFEHLCRIATIAALLALAPPAGAHVDDEALPPNSDEIFIPENLPLMRVVRFTRGDYRLLEDRLGKGDRHHLGTMSLPLSTAAVIAGTHDPRSIGRILWEMSRQATSEERRAYLAEIEGVYKGALAELEAERQAADPLELDEEEKARYADDHKALLALLALVALWQTNPMDGAGS